MAGQAIPAMLTAVFLLEFSDEKTENGCDSSSFPVGKAR